MMARGRRGGLLGLIASALAWWALAGPALAQSGPACSTCATGSCATGSCGTGNCLAGFFCQTHHCPPPLKHCLEGPPRICYKCGCPRPICNPCDLPNFGYFQTCWTPWPADANWSHCSVTPPAAYVQLGTGAVGQPTLATPAPANKLPVVPTPPTSARPMQPTQPQPLPIIEERPRTTAPGGLDVQPLPMPQPLPKGNLRPGL